MVSTIIPFEGVMNIRDLGGMKTKDGRVIKPGMLFRGSRLIDATEKDKEQIAKSVDLIVDFRSEQEIIEQPDPDLEGVTNIHIPILDTMARGVSREKKTDEAATRGPSFATVEDAIASMSRVYARFVESDFSRSQYAAFMRHVIDGGYEKVMWHCTAGKDRTGFAAFLFQKMFDIDDESIMEDYVLTNQYIKEDVDRIKDGIRKREGSLTDEQERALTSLFGAEKAYLRTSIAKIEELYGDFHNYLVDGLRVTDEEQEMLKERYLTKA